MQACDLSADQGGRSRGEGAWGQLGLYSEFEDGIGHTVRLSYKCSQSVTLAPSSVWGDQEGKRYFFGKRPFNSIIYVCGCYAWCLGGQEVTLQRVASCYLGAGNQTGVV